MTNYGKVALNQINDLSKKAATKQEVQNIGNASPKGVYATVAALQTAFPTGTTGIYVIQTDGKWYYWNGTAWNAGGQYQSTGISDNSITPSQASFLKLDTSKNMFDGKYLRSYMSGSAGSMTLGANANGKLAVVKIKPNTSYSISLKFAVLLKYATATTLISSGAFDGAINLNAGSNATSRVFTSGANDQYLYISLTDPTTSTYTDEDVYLKVVESLIAIPPSTNEVYPFTPKGIEIYSKSEVDQTVNQVKNSIPQSMPSMQYSKNGDSFFIYIKSPKTTNYTRYTFSLFSGDYYKVNFWRVTDISIVDSNYNVLYIVCPGYEVECAVQIDTDSFTAGYHGYETLISIETYIDGFPLDMSQTTISPTTANKIEFVTTSTIFRYGTTIQAFTHFKRNTFSDGKFKTYNRLKALAAFTNVKAELCLMSIEKMSGTTPIINKYNDNYNLLSSSTPVNGSAGGSVLTNANVNEINVWGTSLFVKAKIGDSIKVNYKGILSDFSSRVKIYLRPVDSYNMALNEEIFCNGEFTIYS